MKNMFKIAGIMVFTLVILAGCRTANVYNVQNKTIESEKKLSSAEVYKRIKYAGNVKGWIIKKVKPGLAEGKINLRKHSAVVEIPYSANSFSIKYKESMNLNYDSTKGVIHQNYNGWIQNLENAINLELSK